MKCFWAYEILMFGVRWCWHMRRRRDHCSFILHTNHNRWKLCLRFLSFRCFAQPAINLDFVFFRIDVLAALCVSGKKMTPKRKRHRNQTEQNEFSQNNFVRYADFRSCAELASPSVSSANVRIPHKCQVMAKIVEILVCHYKNVHAQIE